MNEVATATVQQVCDLAFYKRQDRWVDSRLVTSAAEVPPGEGHHVRLRGVPRPGGQAGREGRQGSIALRGDILMLVDGQPVLVKAPVVAAVIVSSFERVRFSHS